ncbi:MAG: hypothetical protein M1828_003370 [Chrysothrix sp. TS-e1954]|nr:MAG: hypothetical protein M1828_003370 [Chrysothrix sp. TS-e1954]
MSGNIGVGLEAFTENSTRSSSSSHSPRSRTRSWSLSRISEDSSNSSRTSIQVTVADRSRRASSVPPRPKSSASSIGCEYTPTCLGDNVAKEIEQAKDSYGWDEVPETKRGRKQLATKQHPPFVTHAEGATVNDSTNQKLKPWKKYRKLVGERKFAKNFSEQPFRFLDLPSDVREMIYKQVLLLERAVEIWPMPSVRPDTFDRKPGAVDAMEHKHLRKTLSPKLLRVCRQVYQEGGDVFYGENEFRFTWHQAWWAFHGFLDTIGIVNQSRLKHITIAAPGLEQDRVFSKTGMGNFQGVVLERKHLGRTRITPDLADCIAECLNVFHSKFSNLKTLDLVIHHQPEAHITCEKNTPWHERRVPYIIQDFIAAPPKGVEISVVVLDTEDFSLLDDDEEKQRGFHYVEHIDARRTLSFYKELGLPFFKATRGEFSQYHTDRSASIANAVDWALGSIDQKLVDRELGLGDDAAEDLGEDLN